MTGKGRTARMLVLLLGTAFLLQTASAQAAPPTNFTVSQSARIVTASWTLAPGFVTGVIEFSPTAATDSSGFFTDLNTFYTAYDSGDTTYDSTPVRFPPGTYYAHVSAYDPACAADPQLCVAYVSPTVTLVVPPDAGPPPAPGNFTVGQSSRIVTANWTLAPGFVTGVIEFSPTPDTDSFGFFTDPNSFYYPYDSPDATFDSTPERFAPGTYYAHVSAYDPFVCAAIWQLCVAYLSPTLALVVPPDRGPAPPQPSPPPSPPAPPPSDTIAAFASLSAPATQKVGSLYVRAAMGEAGTISARGTVSVPNLSKVYRFKSVSAPAAAGVSVKLSLKLDRKGLKAVKKALKRKKKLKAKVTIVATDKAGNEKTQQRTIKLKR